MRVLTALALFGIGVSLSHADRLIDAPSGRKVVYKDVKVEGMWELGSENYFRGYVAYGLGTAIDVALGGETIGSHEAWPTLDVTLTLTDPFVNYVPGIAIGVQDAFDDTVEGSRWYAAISYEIGMTGRFNGLTPMQLVLGAGFGSRNGLFVGVVLPFSRDFRLIAEHDSNHITGGVEIRPTPQTSVRWLSRNGQVLLNLGWTSTR